MDDGNPEFADTNRSQSVCSKGMAEPAKPGDRTRLVEGARSGDAQAWRDLVAMHHRLVWWALASFRFDRGTAEDVYQTVWCRLAEQLDRIRDPEALASWLVTTTRNEAIRRQRRADRERPSLIEDSVSLGMEPDEQVEVSDEHRRVREAFGQLDENCRVLLGLLMMQPELSYEEVCEQWGRPIGSIGPTRARCLERLRKLMT